MNYPTIWIYPVYDRTLMSYCSIPLRLKFNIAPTTNFLQRPPRKRSVPSSLSAFCFLILTIPFTNMCMCATRPSIAVRHHPFCMNHKHHRRHSSQPNANNVSPLIHQTSESKSRSTHVKTHKRSLPNDMAFFATSSKVTNTQFLVAPANSRTRKTVSNRFLNGDIDISSDLEFSFASNVSLHSPPRENISLLSDHCEPMDISPAPPLKPVHLGIEGAGMKPSRPRAFTSGARLFGADISNNSNGGNNSKNLLPSPNLAVDASLSSVRSNSKKIQRSALPTEWLAAPNLHTAVRCPFCLM